MNCNKVVLAAVMALGVSSLAHAADQGHGKVTFNGSIIDAPCSIAPGSVDQVVELGHIANVVLKDGGKSKPKAFSIALEDCTFTGETAKNKVSVTFSGMKAATDGLLGITGNASGAGIAITDANGKLIKLGTTTEVQDLSSGDHSLNFAAYLQGDGTGKTVTEGSFQSVADFTLAYN